MASLEVLAVLSDEVAEAATPLAAALGDYHAASGAGEKSEALERYREPVQRIAATAEVLGLAGLRDFCAYVDANLMLLDNRDPDPALGALLQASSRLPTHLKPPSLLMSAEHLSVPRG